VISITDGQIFLESNLFNSGVRPAINAGISVSRVGGNAQNKAMRKVAGSLRLDLAQYRELAAFAQFGSDLDKATRAQLTRGERTVEVLKQTQYVPVPVERQVMVIFAAVNGFIDHLPVDVIKEYEKEFYEFMDEKYADVVKTLADTKQIDDELEKKLTTAVKDFTKQFASERGIETPGG
jgi:F-type H+-transporting ATPase subunit alpha